MNTFPRRLREARKKAGLAQYQVANALGVQRGSVSKWERGRTMPSPVHASMLEALMGCRLPHGHRSHRD